MFFSRLNGKCQVTVIGNLTLFIAMFIVSSVSAGPFWRDKITPSNTLPGDHFGRSVSISGDLCVIGAERFSRIYGVREGSAYIFQFDGAKWSQERELKASDGSAGDLFSYSVAVNADVCVIGALQEGAHDGLAGPGAAYVFRLDGSNWVEEKKLLASDGTGGESFGRSVSISGDVCVVGASGDNDNGTASGSVYIFKFNDPNWGEKQKLLASDGEAFDGFGHSVSVSDGVCIVGAPYEDDAGNTQSQGSAYIFRFNDPNWVQEQKLSPSDLATVAEFGGAVSTSGDVCVVGASNDDDNGNESGSAYIFRFDGNNWIQEQKLLASDGAPNKAFGTSVSISGNICVVGSVVVHSPSSAYIFRFDGGNWVEEAKLVAFDGGIDVDFFGCSVSADSGNVVVGAAVSDNWKGAAYTFRPCPTADLTSDCFVNMSDFAVVAQQWLTASDINDLALLAEEWLIGENLP